MNVVVTGGAGFVGSNLVDRLIAEKHQVTVFDDLSSGRRKSIEQHLKAPGFKFVQLDICNQAKLLKAWPAGTEIVFHLAAIASSAADPMLEFERTTVGTLSVLRAMKANKVKQIVFTSGSGVGDDPFPPESMAGASKVAAEALLSAFCHAHKARAWIVRSTQIIGPRVTHGVVNEFVKRLKANPTELKFPADGKEQRAYLYVDDLVDALLHVRQHGKEPINTYNLSSSSSITVNEIAKIVFKEMDLFNVAVTYTDGSDGGVAVPPRKTKVAKLAWKPKYDSPKAVRATVAWLLGQ
jgi:UDP-glucose 4-epimerase